MSKHQAGIKTNLVIIDEGLNTKRKGKIMDKHVELEIWVRKPFFVEATRITEDNMEIVAAWCGGKILMTKAGSDRYIKVDVKNPMSYRQTMGFVGDWILKSNGKFKVYKDESFHKVFEETELSEMPETPELLAD